MTVLRALTLGSIFEYEDSIGIFMGIHISWSHSLMGIRHRLSGLDLMGDLPAVRNFFGNRI